VVASVVVVALVVLGLMLYLNRRDPLIDALVDHRGVSISVREAATEREVVEAELINRGTELIPALQTELHRGTWRRNSFVRWAIGMLPPETRQAVLKGGYEEEQRRALAALTLGRLGPAASNVIPDLKAMATIRNNSDEYGAEVALAMIQRNDMIIQSNALAALTSANQPRRFYFTKFAYELWPDRPDVLTGPLHDSDAAVRSFALYALGSYGSRASNCVPVLLTLLTDSSLSVRPRAALALGLVAPEYAEIAVAVMLDQQRTNDTWTGDQALVLYQALGPAAKLAVPTLQAELADPRMAMFHGDAAGALWRITGEVTPQIVEGLSTGVRIGVQRTQIRCLRFLQEIGPPAAAAARTLHSMTNHPRFLIRQLAAEALASVERPPAK